MADPPNALDPEFSELAHVYRTAPVGLCLMDPELRFVRINERLAELNGKSVADHLGKTLREVLPELAEQVEPLYRQVLETGQPLLDFEVRGTTPADPDREACWLMSYHPIRSPSGDEIVGIGTVVQDISERKRAEEELAAHRDRLEELVRRRSDQLARSHEKLRRTERLASLGVFAAGIAHRVNNPLGGILLAADYALQPTDDPGVVRKALEDIQSDARRCGDLVRGLLRFARTASHKRGPADPNDVLRLAADAARATLPPGRVEIELDLEPGLPSADLDAAAIAEVLQNLIDNAVDAGAARVVLRTRARPGVVELEVQDDGRGIDADERPRVFDPLFTTHAEDGGTGLGLSIAHRLVSDHDGSIDLRSEPGCGTTVTVELPAGPRPGA